MNINSKFITTQKVRIIETEVYSRVVGYYRPVQNWNTGKKYEFSERNLIDPNKYNINKSYQTAIASLGY